MGLRIAHNISAMTTHRWLGVSDSGLTESLERLSSGYRINRAADDAAGLAISQGFRADIASFKVASRNASEASALLQVAEGGIDQIANMLTRLKELATQASSANAGSSERAKINAEGDALISEIERIANVTMYGSSTLLDGSFGAAMAGGTYCGSIDDEQRVYGSLQYVYSTGGTDAVGLSMAAGDLTLIGAKAGISAADYLFSATSAGVLKLGNGAVTETLTSIDHSVAQTLTFANLGMTFTILSNVTSAGFATAQVSIKDTGLTGLNVAGADSGTYVFSSGATSIMLGNGTATETITGISPGTATALNFSALGVSFSLSSLYSDNDLDEVQFDVTSTGGAGSTFQIGAENNTNNQIAISIDNVDTSTLGISSLDLSEAATAMAALDLVDSAISTLATSRGEIGASMNRLAYAASNLATTVENVQAAESVIRDVDMALEMTEFTKNQILLQAGTAMLAQANMAPQQVLALFG